jgi:hypothetical protein
MITTAVAVALASKDWPARWVYLVPAFERPSDRVPSSGTAVVCSVASGVPQTRRALPNTGPVGSRLSPCGRDAGRSFLPPNDATIPLPAAIPCARSVERTSSRPYHPRRHIGRRIVSFLRRSRRAAARKRAARIFDREHWRGECHEQCGGDCDSFHGDLTVSLSTAFHDHRFAFDPSRTPIESAICI